jgi:hypothetical protein
MGFSKNIYLNATKPLQGIPPEGRAPRGSFGSRVKAPPRHRPRTTPRWKCFGTDTRTQPRAPPRSTPARKATPEPGVSALGSRSASKATPRGDVSTEVFRHRSDDRTPGQPPRALHPTDRARLRCLGTRITADPEGTPRSNVFAEVSTLTRQPSPKAPPRDNDFVEVSRHRAEDRVHGPSSRAPRQTGRGPDVSASEADSPRRHRLRAPARRAGPGSGASASEKWHAPKAPPRSRVSSHVLRHRHGSPTERHYPRPRSGSGVSASMPGPSHRVPARQALRSVDELQGTGTAWVPDPKIRPGCGASASPLRPTRRVAVLPPHSNRRAPVRRLEGPGSTPR